MTTRLRIITFDDKGLEDLLFISKGTYSQALNEVIEVRKVCAEGTNRYSIIIIEDLKTAQEHIDQLTV